tara:strand:- start:967 stop:1332 length:366 start_codon:yes stop_codon:yes gene_type:complete
MSLKDNFECRYDQIKAKFAEFHSEHPDVYQWVTQFTFELIDRGYENYSIDGVLMRVRWEKDIYYDTSVGFKINNNFSAFYARMFMEEYPDHEGFFRTRRQISLMAPAINQDELTPEFFDAL